MPEISEELIARSAPNAAAVSNAKKISKGGDFIRLCRSEDGTLLFGDCQGSGKNPYHTSADFIDPEKPVYRCSCPSRQFPCKHAMALLFDYLAGKDFQVQDIPEDILQKREKLTQSVEKKKTAAPKQVNQAALAKKLKKQIEGLELAERFVSDLLRTGLAAASASPLQPYQELAKQLGDYYLPGPQALINGILIEMKRLKEAAAGKETVNEAACYGRMTEGLKELHAVVKKGRAFLNTKLDTEQVLPEDSLLYDRIGYVWQLAQLKELGLIKENTDLVQLSFHILYDESRAEYDDIGWWVDLATGEISKTENLRPLRAIKHLKQDDTMLECLHTPCLYRYPGEKNKRVRWEEATTRPLVPADYTTIRGFAAKQLAPAIKEAKNLLKNALSEKTVMVLLAYKRIGKIGDRFVLEDETGATVELRNLREGEDTVNRFHYLPEGAMLENQVLAGELFYDAGERQLAVHPHAIVTEGRIVRLLY